MKTPASSSLSFHDDWTYDVFLNFRGKDTRYGFSGSLYYALNKKGIRTFFDDEEIRKGDEITPTLLKAMEKSRMAICVFSRNYASSTFCLDELVHIHQCIKGKGRLVWPIFYGVEPSGVRHQKGIYAQALADHRKKHRADEKKMQSWKLALREIANIRGTYHNPRDGPYECQVIEKIVEEISSKIKRLPFYVESRLLGVDCRQQQINSRLQLGSSENATMFGTQIIGRMGEHQMLKWRRLMEDAHGTSDSLSVEQETKEKPSATGDKNVQVNLLQRRDIESARRCRANEDLVHVRRPEDKGVCWTQEVEALNNDDQQVSRQDHIFESKGSNNSFTWDPMECEYEGTSHNNHNKDPREQRRDHQWTRRLLCSDSTTDIDYESKTQRRDIESARRCRANEDLVHARRPEDKGVCWTQDDDHQVRRQDHIFDSNEYNNSFTSDPMECEYERTSHNNHNKDPREQRRDHQWTRRLLCFNLFTLVASLCYSS